MRTMMIPLGLWIHVIAETIAVLILLLQPSLFESDEAISGLRNGAIAVALVGAAVLSGCARAADMLLHAEGRLVTHCYGLIATYHSVIALQFRSPILAPIWLATLFHGSMASFFWYTYASERHKCVTGAAQERHNVKRD